MSPDDPIMTQPMGSGDLGEGNERTNFSNSAQPSYGADVIAMPPPPAKDNTETSVEWWLWWFLNLQTGMLYCIMTVGTDW